MTHICGLKSKKQFREVVERGLKMQLVDPSIIKPFSGSAAEVLEHYEKNGLGYPTVTNHERTWFAQLKRNKRTGKIRVS